MTHDQLEFLFLHLIGPIVSALAALILGYMGSNKLHEIHLSMNSRLDQLLKAAKAQGAMEERDRAAGALEESNRAQGRLEESKAADSLTDVHVVKETTIDVHPKAHRKHRT